MKKSIKLMVVVAGFVVGVNALAGNWHFYDASNTYKLTVTSQYGKSVEISSRYMTGSVLDAGANTFMIKSIPTPNAKIVIGGSKNSPIVQYGKVDASGNFMGAPKTASIPSNVLSGAMGDPVFMIDVGVTSPAGGISVVVTGMNDPKLSGVMKKW